MQSHDYRRTKVVSKKTLCPLRKPERGLNSIFFWLNTLAKQRKWFLIETAAIVLTFRVHHSTNIYDFLTVSGWRFRRREGTVDCRSDLQRKDFLGCQDIDSKFYEY